MRTRIALLTAVGLAVALALLAPPPAAAQKKEILQLQADMERVIQTQRDLQRTVDEKNAVLKTLVEQSLDAIFKKRLNPKHNLDAVEGKLFGIGAESFTVGMHEFYLGYAVKNRTLVSTVSSSDENALSATSAFTSG